MDNFQTAKREHASHAEYLILLFGDKSGMVLLQGKNAKATHARNEVFLFRFPPSVAGDSRLASGRVGDGPA